MANAGGKLQRTILPPEVRILDHEDRIKILERLRVELAGGGSGFRLLSGVGPPSNGLGEDGDFYIDYLNWIIYGPKLGVWPAGHSLEGPQGGFVPRRTVYAATGPINYGQTVVSTGGFFPQDRMITIAADANCRIRIYPSMEQLESDLARSVFVDPTIEQNHGLLLEVSLHTVTLPLIDLAPPVTVYRRDINGETPIAITNTHGVDLNNISVMIVTAQAE